MSNPPSFLGNLVGVSFIPKDNKVYLEALEPGIILQYEREPENDYDENAIRILAPNPIAGEEPIFIGHLERGVAAPLSQWMDEGYLYRVTVHSPTEDKRRPWLLQFEPTGEQLPPSDMDEDGNAVA